ncbi:MAG: SCO family protein [Bacteroidota bacterium]
MKQITLFTLLFLLFTACETATIPENTVRIEDAKSYHRHHPMDADEQYFILDSLTYLGNFPKDADGNLLPEPVRNWTRVTQLGDTVTNKDLLGTVYIADFFFTSCPTICPTVKANMLRFYEQHANTPNFKLVSFTIDPKRDTPEAMKEYAEKLGVTDHDKWWYLHGDRFDTYELDADYLSIAEENPDAPGGFDHSGYIVLVDEKGFVRSYASGLDPAEVEHLLENVKLLL